jgi:hypothetical protein
MKDVRRILKAGATLIGQKKLRSHDAAVEGSLGFASCGGAPFKERHYKRDVGRSAILEVIERRKS